MAFDWEEIKYQWNDLRYRPEVKRRLLTAGAIAIIVFVVGAFLLSVLTSGGAEKQATANPVQPRGVPLAAPSYTGAKQFAEDLASELSGDQRFAGVAVVPTVTGRSGEVGRIVLMGQLGEAALSELRSLVARKQPPVKIEWRISKPGPGGG